MRDLLTACQDIVRDYATRYKAFEAQDILVGRNYAVDELKRLDLLSLVSVQDELRVETYLLTLSHVAWSFAHSHDRAERAGEPTIGNERNLPGAEKAQRWLIVYGVHCMG